MAKRGKVGCGGREIMAALYGQRGRPETNQWAALCAERQLAHQGALRVLVTYVPDEAGHLVESPRTSQKWSKARAIHRKNAEEN
jgi:predicted phage gp36 major capsid-like protein